MNDHGLTRRCIWPVGLALLLSTPAAGADRTLDRADLTLDGDVLDQGIAEYLSMGDTNGDGEVDLLVGASLADAGGLVDNGVLRVYRGPDKAIRDTSGASVTLQGSDDGERFGHRSVTADLDGDGIPDLVVGAPRNDDGGSNAGKLYVFYGPVLPSSGTLVSDDADTVIEGPRNSSQLGMDLDSGDLDGDGQAELLVGAPGYRGKGAVYVFGGTQFSGRPGSLSTSSADFSWVSTSSGEDLGFSVAVVDHIADGRVLIGAPGANSNVGRAYVTKPFSGWSTNTDLALSSDNVIDGDPALYQQFGIHVANAGKVGAAVDAGLLVVGEEGMFDGEVVLFVDPWTTGASSSADATTAFGSDESSVSSSPGSPMHLLQRRAESAGDVDGDGFADILLSDPEAGVSQHGAAYLFLTNPLPTGTAVRFSDADLRFVDASDAGAAFGLSLAAGDFNHDGKSDVVAGAPSMDDLVSGGGGARLFHGPFDPLSGVVDLMDADQLTLGTSSYLGDSVRGLGDINCDGVPDLGVGDAFAAGGGRLLIHYGEHRDTDRSLGWLGTTLVPGDADVTFNGSAVGDRTGTAFNAAGDVNGDGCDDLLVASPGFDDGATSDVGVVHLLLGDPSLPVLAGFADAIEVKRGSYGGHRLGSAPRSLAVLGDVNGDGLDDFAIGDPDGSGGGSVQAFAGSAAAGFTGCQTWSGGSTPGFHSAFGTAIADRADYDGNGVPDLVASDPYTVSPFSPDAFGAVFVDTNVYCGGSVVLPPPTDATISDPTPFTGFGHALTSVDQPVGPDHLLVSAPVNDGGRVTLIDGGVLGARSLPGDFVTFCPPNEQVDQGYFRYDDLMLGWDVHDGAVVDSNGVYGNDIVMGAPTGDADPALVGPGTGAGAAYIVHGENLASLMASPPPGCVPIDVAADVSVFGDQPGDQLGWSTRFVSDLNQDGEDDVSVGVPGFQSGAGASATVLSSH